MEDGKEEKYTCDKCGDVEYRGSEIKKTGCLLLCPKGHDVTPIQLKNNFNSEDEAETGTSNQMTFCPDCRKSYPYREVMYKNGCCPQGHYVLGEEQSQQSWDWSWLRKLYLKYPRPFFIFLFFVVAISVTYFIWNGMSTKTAAAAQSRPLTANLQVADLESQLAEAEKKIQDLTAASLAQIESSGQRQTAGIINTSDSLLADLHEEEYSLKNRLNGEYNTGLANMDSLRVLAAEVKGQKELLDVLVRKSDQTAEAVRTAKEEVNLAKIMAEEADQKVDDLTDKMVTLTANQKQLRLVVVDFFKASVEDKKSFGRKTSVAKAAETAFDALTATEETTVTNNSSADSEKVVSDEELLEKLLK